jgi:hypothetical protein
LSGNTVYLNNATITSNATALTFTNQAGGTFVLSGTGQSGSNTISNGSSNVNIAAAAGPVTIGVAGVTRGTFNANGLQVTGGAITASGNIVTGGFFIGDVIGNITGNLVVPGTNTDILFNQFGNAAASPALKFDYVANLLAVLGNATVSNTISANSLAVTGNITAGNITGVANVNATTHTGTTVSVTGNITGGNLLAPGAVIATLLTGGNLQVTGGVSSSTVTAVANITGGNINTAGV